MNDEEKYKAFDMLPIDVREAIVSVKTAGEMDAIAEKYGLTLDQGGFLSVEIRKVMYGITHPSDFVSVLMKELDLTQEKAKMIGTEVNQVIFRPIKESLKKIHGISDESMDQKVSDIPEINTAGSGTKDPYLEVIPQKQMEDNHAEHGLLRREDILHDIEKTERPNVQEIAARYSTPADGANLTREELLRDIEGRGAEQSATPATPNQNPGMGNKIPLKTEVRPTPPPPPAPPLPQTTFEDRLKRITTMTKEEVRVSDKGIVEERSHDPYREPLA